MEMFRLKITVNSFQSEVSCHLGRAQSERPALLGANATQAVAVSGSRAGTHVGVVAQTPLLFFKKIHKKIRSACDHPLCAGGRGNSMHEGPCKHTLRIERTWLLGPARNRAGREGRAAHVCFRA